MDGQNAGALLESRLFLLGFVHSLWASVSRKILSANTREVRNVHWPSVFSTLLFITGKLANAPSPDPAPKLNKAVSLYSLVFFLS